MVAGIHIPLPSPGSASVSVNFHLPIKEEDVLSEDFVHAMSMNKKEKRWNYLKE